MRRWWVCFATLLHFLSVQASQPSFPEPLDVMQDFVLPEKVRASLLERGFDPEQFHPDPARDEIRVMVGETGASWREMSPGPVVDMATSSPGLVAMLETGTGTKTGAWWWWIGHVYQCRGFYYYWWHRHWWRAWWGRWYRFWVLHRGFHHWNCRQCLYGQNCVWCNNHCRVDARSKGCSRCLIYMDGQNMWREGDGCTWYCPHQSREPFEVHRDNLNNFGE